MKETSRLIISFVQAENSYCIEKYFFQMIPQKIAQMIKEYFLLSVQEIVLNLCELTGTSWKIILPGMLRFLWSKHWSHSDNHLLMKRMLKQDWLKTVFRTAL
jgi:K+-transporting ATPase A subunit